MYIQKTLCAFMVGALSIFPSMAQQTYEEMEQLTVNEQVTTVITATEPIRFVDISTDKVVGDQPMNNTIRLKPKDSLYVDGQVLAIVTIVTDATAPNMLCSIPLAYKRRLRTKKCSVRRWFLTTILRSACPQKK